MYQPNAGIMTMHSIKEIKIKFLSVSVIITLLTLIILQLALYLHGKGIITLPASLKAITSSITLIIVTVFFTVLILRLTIRRIAKFFDEPEERIFYTKIYSWTIYGVGIVIILHHFGVSIGNITIFIGLLTTGLAFAVRDVLLSFFGWMILLRKKPFHIGDYIKIGDDEGRVLHIGTFYVHLDNTRDIPEDYIRVPNRLFLEKSICNLGKESLHEQIRFRLAQLPENNPVLEQALIKGLGDLPNTSGRVAVYIDMKEDKLYLVVEYLASFEKRHETRAKAINLVFTNYQNYIIIPRGCGVN